MIEWTHGVTLLEEEGDTKGREISDKELKSDMEWNKNQYKHKQERGY